MRSGSSYTRQREASLAVTAVQEDWLKTVIGRNALTMLKMITMKCLRLFSDTMNTATFLYFFFKFSGTLKWWMRTRPSAEMKNRNINYNRRSGFPILDTFQG